MTNKAISPEEAMPDSADHCWKNGAQIRKGTVVASLANADIIEQEGATNEEKEAALAMLKTLAPTLIKAGLMKHLHWKNPQIQAVFSHALNDM